MNAEIWTHTLKCDFTWLLRMRNGRWLDIGYEPWACDPAYYVDDGFGNLILWDPGN